MSEQGQTPPPPEPGAPQNDPQVARPAPDQATTPLPATDQPAAPGPTGQPDPAPQAVPPPQAAPAQAAPAAGQPAATAAQAPSDPSSQAVFAAAPPPAPVRRSRVRGFARHRAIQLVAVGLLGLVLGGGIVGAIAANRFDDRGGPGHVRMYERGDRGPDRFDDRRGGRFDDRFEGRPGFER